METGSDESCFQCGGKGDNEECINGECGVCVGSGMTWGRLICEETSTDKGGMHFLLRDSRCLIGKDKLCHLQLNTTALVYITIIDGSDGASTVNVKNLSPFSINFRADPVLLNDFEIKKDCQSSLTSGDVLSIGGISLLFETVERRRRWKVRSLAWRGDDDENDDIYPESIQQDGSDSSFSTKRRVPQSMVHNIEILNEEKVLETNARWKKEIVVLDEQLERRRKQNQEISQTIDNLQLQIMKEMKENKALTVQSEAQQKELVNLGIPL